MDYLLTTVPVGSRHTQASFEDPTAVKDQIKIFPNPARDMLYIHPLIGIKKLHIEIFDEQGKLVFSIRLKNPLISTPIKINLPRTNNLFNLKIIVDDKFILHKSILKQ